VSLDLATLALTIDNAPAEAAAGSLDKLTAAAGRTEAGANRMLGAFEEQTLALENARLAGEAMGQSLVKEVQAAVAAAEATARHTEELRIQSETASRDAQALDEIWRMSQRTSELAAVSAQRAGTATGSMGSAIRVAATEAEHLGANSRQSALKMEALVIGLGSVAQGGEGMAAGISSASRSLSFLTLSNPELFALVTTVGLLAAG
jgi:hypothetical protein